MADGYIVRRGAAPLNFKVVAATSAPAAPAENTLWVNTGSAITSWVFSPAEPESPAEGMVWFQTGGSGDARFNALKKNAISLSPVSCRQYLSGAWQTKDARLYADSAWQLLWNGQLYDSGKEYEAITGGWKVTALAVDGGASAGGGEVTKNADSMVFTGRGAVLHCAKKIDLTEYSKISLTGTLNGAAGEPTWCNFRIWSELGSTQAANVVARYDSNGTSTNPSIDISGLEGEFVVGFGCHGSKSVTVYKLILE